MHRILITSLLALAAVTAPAHAQSADELIAQIEAQATEIDKFRTLLNSPEQSVRLAAFRAMAESGNAEYRALAIETGLASSDQTMQGLALIEAFNDLNNITLVYDFPSNANRELVANIQRYVGSDQYAGRLEKLQNNLREIIPGQYELRNECLITVAGIRAQFDCDNAGDGTLTLTSPSQLTGTLQLRGGSSDKTLLVGTTVTIR